MAWKYCMILLACLFIVGETKRSESRADRSSKDRKRNLAQIFGVDESDRDVTLQNWGKIVNNNNRERSQLDVDNSDDIDCLRNDNDIEDRRQGIRQNRDENVRQLFGIRNRITTNVADSDTLLRQKLILDVLINVNGRLLNDELIRRDDDLVLDHKHFTLIDEDMRELVRLCRTDRLLTQTDEFDALNKFHVRQMLGLYKLLVHAKHWSTFERVVVLARRQLNGVLVTNALILAVREREDTRDLVLPPINEILPQLFLDENIVRRIQNVNINTILGNSRQTSINQSWKDVSGGNRGDVRGIRGTWDVNRDGRVDVGGDIEDIRNDRGHIDLNGERGDWSSTFRGGRIGQGNGIEGIRNGRGRVGLGGERGDWSGIRSGRFGGVRGKRGSEIEGGIRGGRGQSGIRTWQEWRDIGIARQMERSTGSNEMVRDKQDQQLTKVIVNLPKQTIRQSDLNERIQYLTRDLGFNNFCYAMSLRNILLMGDNSINRDRSVMDNSNENNSEDIRQRWQTQDISINSGEESIDDLLTSREDRENRRNSMIGGTRGGRLLYVNWKRQLKDLINRLNRNDVNSVEDSNESIIQDANRDQLRRRLTGSNKVSIEGLDIDRSSDESSELYKDSRVRSRVPRSLDQRAGGVRQEQREDVRQGELFVQNVQQMLARINLEKISHLAEDIRDGRQQQQLGKRKGKKNKKVKGTDLTEINLVRLLNEIDGNNRNLNDVGVIDQMNNLEDLLRNLLDREVKEISQLKCDGKLDVLNTRVHNIIGEILLGRIGTTSADSLKFWHRQEQRFNEVRDRGTGQIVLADLGRQLSDPLTLSILTVMARVIDEVIQKLPEYTEQQLTTDGILLNDVRVMNRLETYCDTIDSDINNLLTLDELNGIDDLKRVQKQIVVRQDTLNHRQFNIHLDITSKIDEHVVVRTLIGPKLDVANSIEELNEIRRNFILVDAFATKLKTGHNLLVRNIRRNSFIHRDVTTLTQLYRNVLLGLEHQLDLDLSLIQENLQNCRIPSRLLLPRGLPEGLPLQMLVVVTPQVGEDITLKNELSNNLLCGMGTNTLNLDSLPLNFPLDRQLRSRNQLNVSNILLKDILIYHV